MGIDELGKEHIVQFNMCIIHAIYKNVIEQISKKYDNVSKQQLQTEYLYEIMHTSREDFSRYKNGKLKTIRKVMSDQLISEYDGFEKILSGDILLETNHINLSWVKEHMGKSGEEIVSECVIETEVAVNNAMKIHKKEFVRENGEELDKVITWMIEKVGDIWKKRCGSNHKIQNAMQCMEIISVEDLSNCDYELLKEAYSKIQKKYVVMGTVFGYRKLIE